MLALTYAASKTWKYVEFPQTMSSSLSHLTLDPEISLSVFHSDSPILFSAVVVQMDSESANRTNNLIIIIYNSYN